MDRRHFIRVGLAGIGGAIVAPKTVLASAADSPMAGGLYYTEDAPGRWSKKVLSHLPNIEVDKQEEGTVIRVLTRHTMEEYDHYIVKHIVLDKDFRFVDENMFNPMQDKEPLSEFSLGGYIGPVHVLSVCNQHDTWLNVVEI